MKLTITTSGGIGGFGLAKSASVDLADLPDDTASHLTPARLADAVRQGTKGYPDGITYHLVIEDRGQRQSFDLGDAQLPAELLDAIDSVLARGGK